VLKKLVAEHSLANHYATNCFLSSLAGAFSVLAYAPNHWWWTSPLAFVVPLYLTRSTSLKKSALLWFCFGLGKYLVGSAWLRTSMMDYGGLPLAASLGVLLVFNAYQALYPMCVGMGLQKLNPKGDIGTTAWLFAPLWCLAEWLRGQLLTGFPWIWDGYAFVDTPLIALAPIMGALGLTFVAAGIGALLWFALLAPQKHMLLASGISLGLLSILYGYSTFLSPIRTTGETIQVTAVQGNIPQSLKWDPKHFQMATNRFKQMTLPYLGKSDLIFWTESALATTEHRVQPLLHELDRRAAQAETAIITGITTRNPEGLYNGLIVLGSTDADDHRGTYQLNNSNRYQKHHLLPVGEYTPFMEQLRDIAPFFNLPMSNFSAGPYQQPNVQAKGLKLLPLICYEIAFAEQMRANFTHETNLLVTLSNDTWFGTSIGPHQHMQIAQMRAAEMGRPLVRGTNNGITALVDHKGAITHRIPQYQTHILTGQVSLTEGVTLFQRWGYNFIVFISLAMLLGYFLWLQRLRVKAFLSK
jgi:apolipoprotein N-acyltransferase